MQSDQHGQSVEISVDPAKLRGVLAVVRLADRLANRVMRGDSALTDSTVLEAARDYQSMRAEWKP